MSRKIGFISLGCPKNTVDSEIMLAHLKADGWNFTEKFDDADTIVINTCAFIEPAKEEAIEAILEAAELKKTGKCRRLIIAGCMVNRYRDELKKEIPEIDAFVDTFSLSSIINAAREKYREGETKESEKSRLHLIRQWSSGRLLFTPSHYAYLKIADGCSHRCSFCAIPIIKGSQVSRPAGELLKEAKVLAENGVKELILISQDTTSWGKDLNPPGKLIDLLRRLDESALFRWIRLMYLYPSQLDDRLIDEIARGRSILPYFDIPLQHSHPDILKKMGRSGNGEKYLQLLSKIRTAIPSAVIRSSFIAGFPGENEETVKHLGNFLSAARIDNVGIFIYSHEEGTAAYDELKNEISPQIKTGWQKKLMKHQSRISKEIMSGYKGKTIDVIIDGEHPESEYLLSGRFYGQAPEIDGNVIITEGTADAGEIVKVKISRTWEYDLAGKMV
jgi:ribosomal protein S12 methylthiotransferase